MSFQACSWPLPANVRAGWTTRQGGVSKAPFDSFNVANHVGDLTENVEKNRNLLKSQLAITDSIAWLNQTHSVVVCDVTDADVNIGQDASYTQDANKVCCVMTADCLPVFFWDNAGSQVAVAHAGWRGLADGILLNTFQRFENSSTVNCGFGPCIGSNQFEVGEDLLDVFSDFGNTAEFFKAKHQKGKYLANLVGLATHQLQQAGVKSFFKSDQCTVENPDQYYSYRREGQTGRMANVIWKISGS